MSLIAFGKQDNNPIYIESKSIVGLRKKEENSTYVFVAVGNESEEWIVDEDISTVLSKIPDWEKVFERTQ